MDMSLLSLSQNQKSIICMQWVWEHNHLQIAEICEYLRRSFLYLPIFILQTPNVPLHPLIGTEETVSELRQKLSLHFGVQPISAVETKWRFCVGCFESFSYNYVSIFHLLKLLLPF